MKLINTNHSLGEKKQEKKNECMPKVFAFRVRSEGGQWKNNMVKCFLC